MVVDYHPRDGGLSSHDSSRGGVNCAREKLACQDQRRSRQNSADLTRGASLSGSWTPFKGMALWTQGSRTEYASSKEGDEAPFSLAVWLGGLGQGRIALLA
jgi:hypothetical protein